MASQNQTPQQVQTSQFKKILKSFDVSFNVDYTGGGWDVLANANGAISAASIESIDTTLAGNDLSTATDYALAAWLNDFSLTGVKPGFLASGYVTLSPVSGPMTPTMVPNGTQMYIGNLQYITTQDVNVTSITDTIPLEAISIGAEYNINIGVNLLSPSITSYIITSQGISGGSGRESNAQVQQRIKMTLAYRNVEGTLATYNQEANQFISFVQSNPIFVSDVIPVGALIQGCNIIQDYTLAASKLEINSISLSADQVSSLLAYFNNQRSTNNLISVQTLNTQEIGPGVLQVHVTLQTGYSLTDSVVSELQQATRIALLQFQGEVLFQAALNPVYPSYVTSYYFEYFLNIPRVSPVMDCIFTNIAILTP